MTDPQPPVFTEHVRDPHATGSLTPADPLGEAMIAAANAVDAYVAANPGPHPPPAALIIGLSVPAAAPIIAAPIQAELDEYHDALLASVTEVAELGAALDREHTIEKRHLAEAVDLRARLATAERDTLTRAADAVEAEDEWLYHVSRSDVADWLRERAKEAGGE